MEACQSGVQFCLQQDAAHADAHLLLAELHLARGATAAAAQSLEMALSSNFEVRLRGFTVSLQVTTSPSSLFLPLSLPPSPPSDLIAGSGGAAVPHDPGAHPAGRGQARGGY